MIYYDVLTRQEKELWDIVKLAADNKYIGTTEDLAMQVAITTFVAEKRLVAIDTIWQALFSVPSPIREQEEVVITTQELIIFQNYLLDHSLSNTLLVEVFLNRLEITDVPQKYGVSQATAYRFRKEVSLVLAGYGLELKGNCLQGDERLIRNLFLNVMTFRQLPFSELVDDYSVELVTKLVELIEARQAQKILPSKRRLLTNFVFVSLMRILDKCYVSSDFKLSSIPAGKTLSRELQSFARMDSHFAKAETAYLEAFLYAEDFSQSLQLGTSPLTKKVKELERVFLPAAETSFDFTGLTNQQKDQLQQKLNQLHWRHLLLPYAQTAFNFETKPEWFDYFGDFFEVISDLFSSVNFFDEVLAISEQEKNQLIYDYLFLLLEYGSDKTDYPRVYLCADFTQSPALSATIARILSLVWFSCLVIQDQVDEQTDIYLTDTYDHDLTKEQIIWTHPPDYAEQFAFWGKVAAISIKKAIHEDSPQFQR